MKIVCFIFLLLAAGKAEASLLSDYFGLVNEAELLICNNRLEAAMQHYDKAFSLKRDAFGRDVYNAWICAYLSNDEKRFRTYSVHLIKKEAYQTQTLYIILNPVPGGPDVRKFEGIYRNLSAAVIPETDTVYKNALERLAFDDLQSRIFFRARCGNQYNTCGRDSLNLSDSLNVLKLRGLFDRKGFATESKVGFPSGMPVNTAAYDIILRHDRSWTNRKVLDSFLYTKVMAGQYHPQDYALLKDQSWGSFRDSVSPYQQNPDSRYASYLFTVVNKALYISDPGPEALSRANTTRESIYLESLEDMSVKARFQFLHPHFKFLNDWYLAEWDNVPEEKIGAMLGRTLTAQQLEERNTIRQRKCKHGLGH